jgi:biotin carboxyl carrier protein
MRYTATVGDRELTIDVQDNGHVRAVSLNGRPLTVDWRLIGAERPHAGLPGDSRADQYSLLIGHHSYEAYARVVEAEAGAAGDAGRVIEVYIHGRPYVVGVQDERSRALASLAGGAHVAGDAMIRAPMPGLVANVLAAEGAAVQRGQTVVVLEAMKMENDLTAPRAGIVKAVHVAKGQTVGQNDVLAVIGDPAGAALSVDADEDNA